MNSLKVGGLVVTPAMYKPSNSGGPDESGIRILVADDVPGILEIVVAVLNRAGYRATGVSDGAQAWAALCEEKYDLLITDHDMPRVTGLDLLRRLRAGQINLPKILMSGRIPYEEPDLTKLTSPGMIMAKPFSFNELLSNVSQLLAQEAERVKLGEDKQDSLRFDNQPWSAGGESWRNDSEGASTLVRLIGTD